jgi:DGQHR domain-containing protein
VCWLGDGCDTTKGKRGLGRLMCRPMRIRRFKLAFEETKPIVRLRVIAYTSTMSTESFSVSLITQGKHRFFTLSMPSDVLAETCFVSTRHKDPDGGFQRQLDESRAREIARYIDEGLGTIPGSIILSAQPDANLVYDARKKTIRFERVRNAFLIIDGQHRVFGFALATTSLRVPVVIYEGLDRVAESRLFIDINTKQRSVPNELLLDIKSLADYESESESLMREVFDLFNRDSNSPLQGLLSPSDKMKGKISRVTFNAALKPLIGAFTGKEPEEIYAALRGFVAAFISGADKKGAPGVSVIVKPVVFRAAMQLFPQVAQRVKDKNAAYSVNSFAEALAPMFSRLKTKSLTQPPISQNVLFSEMSDALRTSFTL